MNLPEKYDVVAAIDIGSNKISMTIAEITAKGKVKLIEDVRKSSSIGKDTFNDGRISAETIYETCDTLMKFSILMKDYGIVKHIAVATSGLREADNSEYVIDQIKIKTGINVEIINNAQERYYSYLALRNTINEKKYLLNRPVLVVNISSGGVELSVQRNGRLIFTEYLKLGSLRLRETLAGLESITVDYPQIMEEFIESKLYLVKNNIRGMKIKNFIGLGGEMGTILKIIHDDIQTYEDEVRYIKTDTLTDLYNKLKGMSIDQITDTYDIGRAEAEILLPTIILFICFIKMTKAEEILTPVASHRYGILYDILEKVSSNGSSANSNIINAVWKIAKKYSVDKKHASFVVRISLDIFDQTLEISKLDRKDRLYLQIAAILHDVGNYAGFTRHEKQTYNIIKMQSILGISDEELNLIANIAYYHTSKIPSRLHNNYIDLNDNDKIRVSKLSAILKFAESMDCSHKQKIDKLVISKEKDLLVFVVHSKNDTLLEKWSVEVNMNYFEEVMGIRPYLKIVK
jgi:exopolyphosphatase/guanosine-5'-triphosphate,3'-diphosphate pyrophosphatase